MSDFSPSVLAWWLCMTLISAFNVGAWVRGRSKVALDPASLPQKAALDRHENRLSGWYTIICAFRSILPRADVQRICLWDTFASSVFVGRSVATIAELCFVAQWALVVNLLARQRRALLPLVVSFMAVPMIAVAECFSWYAVLTTNYVGNVVEESIWCATGACLAVALAVLWLRSAGELKRALVGAIGCAVSYVAFMSFVDVPMYYGRWQADQLAGRRYFTLGEGLTDLTHRWVTTRAFSEWHEEIPWMTLYFSVAVWLSLALARLPHAWFKEEGASPAGSA